MVSPLHVLILEDRAADAELMAKALERRGFNVSWTRVEDRAGFEQALAAGPDVVLSDFNVPGFDGFAALALTRERYPDLPFVLVTGAIGDMRAAEAVRRGADDYVLKSALVRLPTSVQGALQRRRAERHRREAEAQVRAAEEQLRVVIGSAPLLLLAVDAAGIVTVCDGAALDRLGVRGVDVVGRSFYQAFVEPLLHEPMQRALDGAEVKATEQVAGRWLTMDFVPLRRRGQDVTGALCVGVDVTDQRAAEEHLRRTTRAYHMLSLVNETLLRAEDVETLFREACHIIADHGDYRAAWVGIAQDPPSKPVAPRAVAGDAAWMRAAEAAWSEAAAGPGPLARALRDGKPAVARASVAVGEGGLLSLAAFPLGNVAGEPMLLCVASSGGDAFDADEMALLTRLAGDVGFALAVHAAREERDQATAANERLVNIIEQSDVAMVFGSPEGVIEIWNRGAERLLGWTAAEMRGQTSDATVPAELKAELGQALARVMAGEEVDLDIVATRKDGSKFDAALTVAGTRDARGQLLGVSTVIRDVTERRRASDAEREARDRAAEVSRLEEMARFRAQFINTAAHELNTPLTPLALELDLLRKGKFGPLTPRQEEAAAMLERNLTRMSLLVADMLDSARIQAGKLRIVRTQVDLGALGQEALAMFREHAARARLELELDAGPGLEAEADGRRVMQVLTNLLSNAVKFTPPGGQVRIRARREGGDVVVQVADTGLGLTEEQRGKLFQPFVQVQEPVSGQRSGTGLGLYICKAIVEGHGGRIGVESGGTGKGSTFWFALPARGGGA